MSASGPRQPDPVKAMIAQAVQYYMATTSDRPGLMPQPEDVESIEGQIVSPTETLMRVKTFKHGVRYFKIKVSEMMLCLHGVTSTRASGIS